MTGQENLKNVYQSLKQVHGPQLAARWLKDRQSHEESARAPRSAQEPFFEHESHRWATALLEPYRAALGAAYATLHLLARWSREHASERDPAPHLMTTYWTLEEALGLSERTLRRHLVEDGHPWSETVRNFIDLRPCYGELLCGRGEDGSDLSRPVIVGTIIRFFPEGRYSPKACVKRWGRRDLLADSDQGRTKPSRSNDKVRYRRASQRMSGYSPIKGQVRENNWFMVKLGQTVTDRGKYLENPGNLYADIPKNAVLDALRQDLALMLENARAKGSSLKRARTWWVNAASQVIAERFGDNRPQPRHLSEEHTTHWDGFTDLWRRALWTAIKTELYGGTARGWVLVQQCLLRAEEGRSLQLENPVAWAWASVREELEALRRDYGSGMAGVILLKPPPVPFATVKAQAPIQLSV